MNEVEAYMQTNARSYSFHFSLIVSLTFIEFFSIGIDLCHFKCVIEKHDE